ncbi:DUF4064 domain-containing protein [Bacillus sp. FJAT-49736]|uniref:DUF4064 domain-containing protein n=1 Tax=Bacillus sp. FJAT-49736 TaxID=2833582 RepID=UPI001BC99666|nr:DUF4064 domain-containing protein [Bacillus sp. FJAT-49736]MBS4175279.1 DUF4064 domain-containing protein [Bacillus sp. FJAT-49736]
MKRTAEITLSIIGVVISAFVGGAVALIGALFKNESFQEQIKNEMENDPDLGAVDPSSVLNAVGNGSWWIVIASLVGIILGILAAVYLKGNKKPKLAGILLIIAAVISVIMTVGVNWLPGILFLIAGILSLARKPKKVIEE